MMHQLSRLLQHCLYYPQLLSRSIQLPPVYSTIPYCSLSILLPPTAITVHFTASYCPLSPFYCSLYCLLLPSQSILLPPTAITVHFTASYCPLSPFYCSLYCLLLPSQSILLPPTAITVHFTASYCPLSPFYCSLYCLLLPSQSILLPPTAITVHFTASYCPHSPCPHIPSLLPKPLLDHTPPSPLLTPDLSESRQKAPIGLGEKGQLFVTRREGRASDRQAVLRWHRRNEPELFIPSCCPVELDGHFCPLQCTVPLAPFHLPPSPPPLPPPPPPRPRLSPLPP